MLFLIKALAGIFSVLNSEESPRGVAAGFAFGVLLGLLPIGLLATLLGILAFLVNINLAMMGVAAVVFKIIAFAIDPVANKIGYWLLVKISPLQPFWTTLYNTPLVPYTKFNNTLVIGSLAIGVALLIPMYFLGMALVAKYRTQYRDVILKWKVVKILQSTRFYRFYLSYKGFTGE